MKRLLTIMMSFVLPLALAACGGNADAPSENTVLDLTGGWEQSNSDSDTSYQIAMIDEGTIEVYWKGDDDEVSLYWAGTYIAPTAETGEYTWDSVNDKSRTNTALLASGDDSKKFTYKNGILSYPVTAMGVTKTVELKQSEEVNIQVEKAVTPQDLLPLELIESGYAIKEGYDSFYIQYAMAIKNPNTERAVEFPKVRLTARDSGGGILGTQDSVGSSIMPGKTWYSAFQGPSVDSEPASVDFEIIQPDEDEWVSPDRIDYAGEPLTVENPTMNKDKIVGEVSNPNDFDIGSVSVVVFFRDENGKLIAGETTFTDKILANSKIPFEISLWETDGGYVTEMFEVFAYPWY